ncbi:MAG: 50S ribosomal protein L25 [Candidatus Aminicenantes bacterium]|nr:50S ribosomal protein L25 [Candidatus Aminicenantes bacterium]
MTITIKGEKRELFGKNEARRARSKGMLPAILYGKGIENVPLILEKKDVFSILKSETGENTIFKVAFDSEKIDTMIKDFQLDPVTDQILHVDLVQIALDKMIRVTVPFSLIGEAVGVKAEGGFVDSLTREVEIECLPKDIPESIQVDINGLHLNQSVKIGDVIPPEGVKILDDPHSLVVLIGSPTKEEEKAAEGAEEEEEIISKGQEPELIKKEKEEE